MDQTLRFGPLILSRSILDEIHSEAILSFPDECCGLMFCGSSEEKKISRALKMKNALEEGERRQKYAIDPKEFLIAEEEARAKGEEIAAVYHSHPDASSKPSQLDFLHAWPDISYIVIEVRGGKAISTSSWILGDDGQEFVPEPIEVGN